MACVFAALAIASGAAVADPFVTKVPQCFSHLSPKPDKWSERPLSRYEVVMKTSLDHLPESKQTAIKDIQRLILNQVESFVAHKQGNKTLNLVSWIILFGSYARGGYVENPVNGYYSDFDVLVVMNRSELIDELKLWRTIESEADRLTSSPLTLIVHSQQEIADWLADGHYFFSDIQREGVYLYSSSGKPLPEPKRLSNRERLPVAQKHFKRWFDSANEFLIDFEHCVKRENYNKAAFELHQCVERFYGCLLLVLTNYRPNTHNLKCLHPMALENSGPNSPIATVFCGSDRFERRCFELLKRAYVDSRYSEHFQISKIELQWLSDQVHQLKDIVKQLCEAHIALLSQPD